MRSLRQALVDYELAMLEAIADCRAAPLDASNHREAVAQLAEALLSPVTTAIILDDLSQAENEALQFLLEQGGQIEEARFSRQYGEIRLMGSARLKRERPWENPANPAEGLWYRGLIFKAFQAIGPGNQEIIFIPDDLLPLLKSPTSPSQTPPILQVDRTAAPAVTISGPDRLRENFFRVLVYLQTTPVRLQHQSELSHENKEALTRCLLPPLPSSFSLLDELDFLLHLGQRANLLTIAHGRLRPERDSTRAWLQSPPAQQLQLLQNTWRVDHSWNELWHTPGLVPQATGWENSPLLARSKILGYLEQIKASSENGWLAIDSFIAMIKRIDPDFQRPTGDYESWYIQDKQGNFLMGFEHWDKIEGALIRYTLTHILLLLGVVELGCPSPTSPATSFRLTPEGYAFLTGQIDELEPVRKPALLRVDHNFYVQAPKQASLYDRFQLARFAELERYGEQRTIYKITPATVRRALQNGVTSDQITAFLARVTNNQTPLKVVETIRAWGSRHASVRLEQATLLRLKHEGVLAELRQQPAFNHLLGEALTPTTLLIPAEHVAEARRLLTELGYLE
jgi:hypothetical protein